MSEMTTEILEESLRKMVLVRLRGWKEVAGETEGFRSAPQSVVGGNRGYHNCRQKQKTWHDYIAGRQRYYH